MSNKKSPKNGQKQLASNRRARHEYHIETTFEAGLVLQGWEVKAIRAGQISLAEAYVYMKNGEAWLTQSNVTPLGYTSTHYVASPIRMRKLLLHAYELKKIADGVSRKGYTVVPLSLYLKNGRIKLEVGLAKGKSDYDKRSDQRDKDWQRDKARVMKSGLR